MSHCRTTPTVAAGFPIRLFRRLRFRSGLFCPRCGHSRVHRWGTFGWRQRYRCLGCQRTFSDFTGTPLAYLKRIELWPAFCRLAFRPTTVRRAARHLGIHRCTSFRWRHRLLAGLRRTETITLEGRVSVDATWFPYSQKGSRALPRPPRRRRFTGLSFETESVWLVVACDESARSLATPIGPRPPDYIRMREALETHVGPSATLVGCGHRGVVALTATALHLDFQLEGALDWARLGARPEPAGFYIFRLRRWLRRFRGVATVYLENYLVWFRLLEVVAGRLAEPPPLAPVFVGRFPARRSS